MNVEIPDEVLASYTAELSHVGNPALYDEAAIESLETVIASIAVTQYQKEKGLR